MHELPELDRAGLRKFGLTMGVVIAVLFGVIFPLILSLARFPLWPWLLAGAFWLWALAAPDSMRGFYRLWMRIGLFMSKIMNPLVLGIVFFLVFLPMGLLRRAFGKQDPMRRKFEKTLTSYRIQSKKIDRNSMEKPF